MGYRVEWLVEKRIVYIRAEGNVSYEELSEGIKRLRLLYGQGLAPVHSISDARKVEKFPTDFALLRQLMRPHSNGTGWSLIIQENPLAAFVSELVTRMAGQRRIKSFQRLEEGLKFLQKQDKTLGKIPLPEDV